MRRGVALCWFSYGTSAATFNPRREYGSTSGLFWSFSGPRFAAGCPIAVGPSLRSLITYEDAPSQRQRGIRLRSSADHTSAQPRQAVRYQGGMRDSAPGRTTGRLPFVVDVRFPWSAQRSFPHSF
jgi:hypothetical protein